MSATHSRPWEWVERQRNPSPCSPAHPSRPLVGWRGGAMGFAFAQPILLSRASLGQSLLRCPIAGYLLLSGVGVWPPPDGVREDRPTNLHARARGLDGLRSDLSIVPAKGLRFGKAGVVPSEDS